MLRLLVLMLILANGVYYAWTEGMLRAYGFAPVQQREPQHLADQYRPQAIQVLSAADLKRAEGQAQADLVPKECLLAGPFNDAQSTVLRRALESSLAGGGWQLDTVDFPARWIVYMGKFPNADAQAKKRAELTTMKLALQPLNNPDLELGLSLGGFDTQAEATAELAKLALRGVHTAKVVQERAAGKQTQLKFAAVSADTKSRLNDIKPALAGHPLHSCSS